MGTLLIIIGIFGLILSAFMFGDIGLAGGIGSLTALFAGIGLNGLKKKVNKIESLVKKQDSEKK